jgi:hypothetical protein
MAWKLHLKLKACLEEYGIEVITTRTNQIENISLSTRGKKAEGCNLFLSIHSNAVGEKVNETVDYPIAFVPINGSADQLGKLLAECVEQTMKTKQTSKSESKKSTKGNWDYYSVINGAVSVGVPGIILEHSFHTNTRATKWLLEDSNLNKLAKAEAEVIAKYFKIIKELIKIELPELSFNMKGETVKVLQVLLISRGYSCGKAGADGKFGENTAKALKTYQKDNKLVVDGICDEKSWRSLLSI